MSNIKADTVMSDVSQFNGQPSSSASRPLASMLASPLGVGYERQILTKDGKPAKKRGPKPDSKPAANEKLEKNRQAQRSHRERKENERRALEAEVSRLKEKFQQVVQDRERTVDENRSLRELLTLHGIPHEHLPAPITSPIDSSLIMSNSDASTATSYSHTTGSTETGSEQLTPSSPATTLSVVSPGSQHQQHQQHHHHHVSGLSPPADLMPMVSREGEMGRLLGHGYNYEQIGVDFVLKLERKCMDHSQYLLVRAHNPENQPHHHPAENPDDAEHDHMSGHALMISAAPYSHIMNRPEVPYPHQPLPGNMPKGSLAALYNFSLHLEFDRDGEVTPIMAFSWLWRHPRLCDLTREDFDNVTDLLQTKTRCYGFGAVLEEWELQQAMALVLASKGIPQITDTLARQQIAVA